MTHASNFDTIKESVGRRPMMKSTINTLIQDKEHDLLQSPMNEMNQVKRTLFESYDNVNKTI